jgi:hypothetical protein
VRSFFLLVLAGLLAVMVTSSARAQYVDEELWLGSGLKQAINKDLSWSLQWENRWTQGMRWHDQGLLDVAIEYQWDKHWSLNAQWRFSERQQKEGGYEPRRRGALRLLGDWKAGRGKVKGRLMWTEDWNPLLAWRDLGTTRWEPTTRMRLGYERPLPMRAKVGASWEVFYRGEGKWSERWQTSASWDVSKNWAVGLSYLFGNEWRADDPWRSHVVRVKTTWTLPDATIKRNDAPAARMYAGGTAVKRMRAVSCEPCTVNQLRITEVNGKGVPADFIELFNQGDTPCDLEGWRITDALDRPGWTFSSVLLPNGACWLGYQGGRNSFDFGISAEGERLFLVAPDGVNFQKHDVQESIEGRSQGVDKSGNWAIFDPSPGTVDHYK